MDYSNFVNAAYLIAGLVLLGLMAFVVIKYLTVKSKVKNEKSA